MTKQSDYQLRFGLNAFLPVEWCFSHRAAAGLGSWTWWSTWAGDTLAPRTPYTHLSRRRVKDSKAKLVVWSQWEETSQQTCRFAVKSALQPPEWVPSGPISIISARQLIEYLNYVCGQGHTSSSRMLHNSLSYTVCSDYQPVQYITLGKQQ